MIGNDEYLNFDDDLAHRNLHEGLAPLRMLDEQIVLPPDLAERTIACVRRDSMRPKPAEAATSFSRSNGAWHSRLNVGVAAALLVLFSALGFGGIGRLRQSHAEQSCRNNLFQLYTDLGTYASLHNGRYPEPGKGSRSASAFVDILMREGFLTSRSVVACPEVSRNVPGASGPVDYAYSLGSVGADGEVHGPNNHEDVNSTPLLADRPLTAWMPRPTNANHAGGANVLFVNGAVRFCTNPNVGWNGDHVYLNQDRRIAAGLHARDAVVGGPEDHP